MNPPEASAKPSWDRRCPPEIPSNPPGWNPMGSLKTPWNALKILEMSLKFSVKLLWLHQKHLQTPQYSHWISLWSIATFSKASETIGALEKPWNLLRFPLRNSTNNLLKLSKIPLESPWDSLSIPETPETFWIYPGAPLEALWNHLKTHEAHLYFHSPRTVLTLSTY